MNKRLKLLLQSTVLATALISLAGCPESEQSSESQVNETTSHMEYKEKQYVQPLNVRTASGSYLVSQHAQFLNDWQTSSKYINQFISENPGMNPKELATLNKRAMILNLGAGNIDAAQYFAESLPKKDQSPLSTLVEVIPLIKAAKYDEALEKVKMMDEGGMSDLIKPIVKNWVMFAQEITPPTPRSVSGQELYHLILAADYAGNSDYLQNIVNPDLSKSGLTAAALENIADIFVRHNLDGRALSLYQDIQPSITGENIASKIELLEKGDDIPEEDLFKKVKSPANGVSMSLLDIGTLLLQEQSIDSARIFAHLALALDPTLDNAYLLLAYVAADYGHYDEAISYFKTVAENDPDRYVEIQRQIADIQEKEGMYEDALKTLEALAEVDDSVEIRTQIGDVARSNDQYKKALKAYNKALSMVSEEKDQSRYWGLYYSRGIAQERLNNWDEAEKDLKKALKLEPNHPYILNYLGYSWADQGKNLNEALEMIEKAVKLRPDDGYIVDSLGWVYFKLGEFEKAVEPLEVAVALMPEDATINDHLGDAYWKVGRKHEARFQWSRALSFAEESPENLSDLEAVELIEKIKEKLKTGL